MDNCGCITTFETHNAINMKKLLLFLLVILSICSCSTGKLEWWEAVNTPPKRAEKATGRNDDSRMEEFLFEKADQLEFDTAYLRTESWIKSGNPILVTLNIILLVIVFACIGLGLYARFGEEYDDWIKKTLGILTILLVALYIPYFLFTEVGTKGNTTDIGAIVTIAALYLCVPYVIKLDDLDNNRMLVATGFVSYAYSILPIIMVLGAIVRRFATWGSYIFLLLMLVYEGCVLIDAIMNKRSFFRTLATLFYVLIITIGTITMLYATMPAMVHLINDILALVLAVLLIKSVGADTSSYAPDPSPAPSDGVNPNVFFDPDNRKYTGEVDADGDEIFRNKIDGRRYVEKGFGFREVKD